MLSSSHTLGKMKKKNMLYSVLAILYVIDLFHVHGSDENIIFLFFVFFHLQPIYSALSLAKDSAATSMCLVAALFSSSSTL